MSARGPILWKIQRLHRAVREAREEAAKRPVVTAASLCPICSEYPIQTKYRGKGLCTRCVEELRRS